MSLDLEGIWNIYLHGFQSTYVLVPAVKAANNVIVVCRKYYLDVVLRELSTSNTCEHDDRECEHIVSEHLQFMGNNRIDVEHDHRILPFSYWLHKQPHGTRFIATSRKCSTKPLSKILTACLRTMFGHFKQYCNGIYSRTGVKSFWVIDTSQQVLTAFKLLVHS